MFHWHRQCRRSLNKLGICFRCRPVGHQIFSQRLTRVDRHFQQLLLNHSNDATGALGEEAPLWFDVLQRFKQYSESQSATGRAQAIRANLREVQESLGGVQPPLGPGNPPLRSEIAAENPPQVGGNLDLGVGMEVSIVDEPNSQQEASQPRRGGRRRRNTSTSGTTRRNRARTGRTIHDDIDDGREQLGDLASSLREMAQSVTGSFREEEPGNNSLSHNSLSRNPIADLRTITESVQLVASNLGVDEQRRASQRVMNSWMSPLNEFDQQNGLNGNSNED